MKTSWGCLDPHGHMSAGQTGAVSARFVHCVNVILLVVMLYYKQGVTIGGSRRTGRWDLRVGFLQLSMNLRIITK